MKRTKNIIIPIGENPVGLGITSLVVLPPPWEAIVDVKLIKKEKIQKIILDFILED